METSFLVVQLVVPRAFSRPYLLFLLEEILRQRIIKGLRPPFPFFPSRAKPDFRPGFPPPPSKGRRRAFDPTAILIARFFSYTLSYLPVFLV